jgi:arylsulfatase A-like enzyme
MHVWTRLKPSSKGKTGIGLYADGMVEHDELVGELLKKIDDLGLRDNTIVIYTTDNGAETVTWPDDGVTPFHGEKGTTWEGGMRVPCLVRWPGVIQPGTIYNNIMSQEDWMPTLLAAAGVPGIVEKLEAGYTANGKTWKVHPDGYDFLPFFKGEVKSSPRDTIFYFGQGGELNCAMERLENQFRLASGQHRRRRSVCYKLADDREPAGRSLRESTTRVRDVHSLDGGQHVAVRAIAAEAQGVSGDHSSGSFPGGNEHECRRCQLQHIEGGAGPEKFAIPDGQRCSAH